ncbi:putative NADH-ubiquinone oxidoreductase subunit GRIM-19 [Aspergillus affinis]|uniref:putative NADH-ubiquinone oxidoreductase subunit GRIM-19 n=1 Tax=Aspergillus affinis TaxID=1070780 RepID=UPI0022FDFB40|nr:putative NADH-ubiquinone oxidoreductase subunit GRIM-19 [Aspergillus affinis]KAI9045538.1 putative NADH-ubiquinone oxidoreductase subunit GRIM-19 [Aspergillus affinis]
MPQDMPPSGGYGPVQYKRNVPARGFRPVYYLLGMHMFMAYGMYKLFYGIREQNELAREKIWGRLHLLPLLQAEEDRDQVRRYYADKAREKELLGSETKVYNSDRFVRPTYAYMPSKVTQ